MAGSGALSASHAMHAEVRGPGDGASGGSGGGGGGAAAKMAEMMPAHLSQRAQSVLLQLKEARSHTWRMGPAPP